VLNLLHSYRQMKDFQLGKFVELTHDPPYTDLFDCRTVVL